MSRYPQARKLKDSVPPCYKGKPVQEAISSENERFIEQLIEKGAYRDRSEALNAAINLLRSRVELLAHIDEGTRQLRNGQYTEYDDESLRRYFDELQQRGRERYDRARKTETDE